MAITLNLFYPIKKVQTFYFFSIYYRGECHFGKDVTIHSGVVIKKGVNIGDYSEVGSNSVIQKDSEDW